MMKFGLQINSFFVVNFSFDESDQLSKTVGLLPVQCCRAPPNLDSPVIERFGTGVLTFKGGDQARMLP